MEINTPEAAFKSPEAQALPIAGKRKKIKATKIPISEIDEEDAVTRLTMGLQELAANPVMLMGVFDMYFEGVPQDIKIQFKDVGIKIQTYFLSEVSDTHRDLIKYLTAKLK